MIIFGQFVSVPRLINRPFPNVMKAVPAIIMITKFPVFRVTKPPINVRNDSGRTNAKRVTPEIIGLKPRITWKYRGRKKSYEMKMKAWRQETVKEAMLVVFWKIRIGMTGFFANLASQTMNKARMRSPNTIRQMTLAEPHGARPPEPASRP